MFGFLRTAVNAAKRCLLLCSKVFRYILIYILSLMIVSPMLGTFFCFFDIYWGWIAFFSNMILAGILFVFLNKAQLMMIESAAESTVLIIITGISICLYARYSPALYLSQDPSIYLLKALNLVNYGYCYKPMQVYSDFALQNIIEPISGYGSGMYYKMPNMYADFFPGGSFFYSLFGMISKDLLFYAQTAIMALNAWLLYFAIKKTAGMKCITAGNYTLMFFAAPMIVWFGRGYFTEPAALLFLLLIINMLNLNRQYPFLLAVCFLSSYSSRIDYLLIMLLGIFILLFLNYKTGILYTLAVVAEVLIYKHSYHYYFGRITTEDVPFLKHYIILIILAFAVSIVFLNWKKELLYQIFYSKAIKYLLAAIGILCLCLMFHNNVVSAEDYHVELIHGRMLRTYEEEILDLLFQTFPGIVLSLGLAGMYKLIDKEKIPFTTSVFILGVGVAYLYLLFGSSNSPQLYWMLRRYYNNIVPVCMLSFCCLFRNLRREQGYLLAAVCMALSLNMYLDSGQIEDYKGLDKSAAKLEQEIKEQGYETVYYPLQDEKQISPLFAYSDLEFIPVSLQDLFRIEDYKERFDFTDSLFLTSKVIDNMSLDPDIQQYEMKYLKLGENYGEIPKDVYDKSIALIGCSMDKFLNGQGKHIYPLLADQVSGIDGDWTLSEAEIKFTDLNVSNESELVFNLYEYDNKFLDAEDPEGLDLQVIVNGKYVLERISYDAYEFRFSLEPIKKAEEDISSIQITCNTFCPADEGKSDARNLGIAIKEMYIQ